MKIYVKSATAEYSADDFKLIAEEVNSTICDSDATEAILRDDKTELLTTFVDNLITDGELEVIGDVLAPSGSDAVCVDAFLQLKPLRKGQFSTQSAHVCLTEPTKVSAVSRKLASEVRKILNSYYRRYEESLHKQALRDEFDTADTKLITAFSAACRYVKKYAKLTATSRYSHSGTAQYMLWSLPGAEEKFGQLNEEVLDEWEHKFRNALARFEEDTGVHVAISCPHGGNYVRAAFEFRVDPEIQLVYNKQDDTYQTIEL